MKRRTNTDPLVDVVDAKLLGWNGALLSPMKIYEYYWEITLACGHEAERPARYPKGFSGRLRGFARLHHPPANREENVLPAPKRVRCDQCAREARKADEVVS